MGKDDMQSREAFGKFSTISSGDAAGRLQYCQ